MKNLGYSAHQLLIMVLLYPNVIKEPLKNHKRVEQTTKHLSEMITDDRGYTLYSWMMLPVKLENAWL